MAPTVRQKNSLHITHHFSNIHLNIILSTKSRFHKYMPFSVFELYFVNIFNFYHSLRFIPYKESGNALTGFWTKCYRMESRVGEISMYTRPPVCVRNFSNHSKLATSWRKMVTECMCVCPHTKLHGVTSQNSIMPTVTTMLTSNLTIIVFSCLLTSQYVSSAHSICTTYSTERGMNATWQSISISIQVF